MSKPLISLVMPALNASDYIGEALDSVACQRENGQNVEVVLADGGSQDNSREIAAHYDFVRILEGKDSGIYDGFNRGITACQGDIIGILNADDCLGENTLRLLSSAFALPEIEMVSGAVSWSGNCQPSAAQVKVNDKPMSIAGLLFGIPAINARFFRRSLIDRVGLFAPEAGIAADRDYLLRVYKSGAKSKNIDNILYHYRIHAGSTTIAGDETARNRVWQAECQLADYLLQGTFLSHDEQKWAKRSRALARLKQAIRDKKSMGLGNDLPHLPTALLAWRQWRAKLSGYGE